MVYDIYGTTVDTEDDRLYIMADVTDDIYGTDATDDRPTT